LTHDVSRADDLVQDTLVRAIAKECFWQCGTNLRAWLFTLMPSKPANVVTAAIARKLAGFARAIARHVPPAAG
jgi:DNA-directed RNA polymerase specialized sigma24 family protein